MNLLSSRRIRYIYIVWSATHIELLVCPNEFTGHGGFVTGRSQWCHSGGGGHRASHTSQDVFLPFISAYNPLVTTGNCLLSSKYLFPPLMYQPALTSFALKTIRRKPPRPLWLLARRSPRFRACNPHLVPWAQPLGCDTQNPPGGSKHSAAWNRPQKNSPLNFDAVQLLFLLPVLLVSFRRNE